MSFFGGGGGGQTIVPTTSTSSIPGWLNEGGKTAVEKATAISNKAYTPFEGPRVAGLAPNQTDAIEMASTNMGSTLPFIDRATGYNAESAITLPEADIGAYMNPYLDQALAPTLRELGESSAKERNAIAARSIAAGGYGGSGSRVSDSEAFEKYMQTVGDVTGAHYAQGFNTAAANFQADRGRLGEAAGREAQLGATRSGLLSEDIDRLTATGALDRGETQANYDRAYMDFLEQRDWDEAKLDTLIRTLSGTPYDRSITTQNVIQNPDPTSQMLGLLLAGGGLAANIWG